MKLQFKNDESANQSSLSMNRKKCEYSIDHLGAPNAIELAPKSQFYQHTSLGGNLC